MRLMIVLGMSVFAAACSGQALDSPTSPSSVVPSASASPWGGAVAPAQTQAQSGTQLPFRGSFTRQSSGVVDCPPTCPPTILTITGNQTGEATHLGRFTATSVDVVDLATDTATGTFNFTAANGDQLLTNTSGTESEFVPPNISHVTLTATIVGGTGRFAAATGTLTIRLIETIDFANDVASGSGTVEGWISLDK
jgi:hypothetical protein